MLTRLLRSHLLRPYRGLLAGIVVLQAVQALASLYLPTLNADIVDKGIVLTGGGALLKNIDVLLREETGLPVMVADDPVSAVVLGSGKTLDHIELLKEVTIG